MGNLFFNQLLSENFSVEGDEAVLTEFKEILKTANLAYHPSSGFDLTDLQYVNSRRFAELDGNDPSVFIHSDVLHIDKYESERVRWRNNLKKFKINSVGSFKFLSNDYKSIEIYKLKIYNSTTVKWLLFFRGYLNEEVLYTFLRHKNQISTVYTYCDGITSGMGGIEESIPTLFYPLIAKEFGIKHIITEQSIDGFFYGASPRKIEYLRRWIKNTLILTGSNALKSLLELDDSRFREILYQTLLSVPQYAVNSDSKKRLFVWWDRSDMVLKSPKWDIMDKLTAYMEENRTVENISKIKGENEEEQEDKQELDIEIGQEQEEKNLLINEYDGEVLDCIYSQDLTLLEAVPVIGKIGVKIKKNYKTIHHLLHHPVVLYPEVRDIRQIITGNKDIDIYLRSQALLTKLKEKDAISDFTDELKLYMDTAFGILPSEEDLENWHRLRFSDYSKVVLPKVLKRMLEKEQPSKLQVLCTDHYSFLRINGMTETKLQDFIEFQRTLIESDSIKALEKLPAMDSLHLDYDYEKTITENIEGYRDLIVDHVTKFHIKYVNKYRSKEIRNLKIFKTYYKEQTNLNYNQIGRIYELSGEMIRLLCTEKEKPYNIFSSFFVSPDEYLLDLTGNFREEIKNILSSELYNPEFGEQLNVNAQNYETLAKYMSLFGFDLAQFQENVDHLYYVLIEPEKYGITKFKHFSRELLQLMKNSPYSLTLEEIAEKLTTKVTVDESVLENVLKYEPYQSAEHEDGTIKYNIQPHLLGSLMLKVERLLFRIGEQMSSAQILEELNTVQRHYGDIEYTADQLIIRSNVSVISNGNNTWIHSEYCHNEEREAPSVFIENLIIANGGKISFTEVADAIRTNLYNIKGSSVRAYITSFCRRSKDDLNLFVHKDYVNNYPEINLHPVRNQLIGRAMLAAYKTALDGAGQFTRDELEKRVYDLLSEEDRDERQIKLYFRNLSAQAYFLEHNGLYLVNPEKNIANIKYRKEPQYKTLIRSFIVQDLKASPEGIPLRKLLSKYKEQIPEGVSINNFYKFFHNGQLFEKFRHDNIEYVKLVPEYLPEAQPANIDTAEPEGDERVTVQQVAEYREDREFNRKDLMDALQERLKPYFISDSHYEQSFNKFAGHLEMLTNGNITLYYLFKVFVLKTDHYERFAYLGNIVNFYEPYLKSLNFETNYQYDQGLGNLIRSNSLLRNLRLYERNMRRRPLLADPRKLYFSQSLNSLLHYRNLKDHDLTSEQLLEENINIVDLISKFVALYMFTITEVYELAV